jgi:hypothetical protein
MDSTSRGDENPACGSAIPPVVVVPEDGQGNVSPTSLVEKIFNDPEALTMLRKAILNEESGEALKARHPQEKMLERSRLEKQQQLSKARRLKGQEGRTVLPHWRLMRM